MSEQDSAETTPAPLMRLPESGLIFHPIRFSHEEEQWLEMMQELNGLLVQAVEAFRIPRDLIGETTNR